MAHMVTLSPMELLMNFRAVQINYLTYLANPTLETTHKTFPSKKLCKLKGYNINKTNLKNSLINLRMLKNHSSLDMQLITNPSLF